MAGSKIPILGFPHLVICYGVYKHILDRLSCLQVFPHLKPFTMRINIRRGELIWGERGVYLQREKEKGKTQGRQIYSNPSHESLFFFLFFFFFFQKSDISCFFAIPRQIKFCGTHTWISLFGLKKKININKKLSGERQEKGGGETKNRMGTDTLFLVLSHLFFIPCINYFKSVIQPWKLLPANIVFYFYVFFGEAMGKTFIKINSKETRFSHFSGQSNSIWSLNDRVLIGVFFFLIKSIVRGKTQEKASKMVTTDFRKASKFFCWHEKKTL